MRLALLSNITVDFLAESLKKNNDVYTAPGYDTWQQEVINNESGLYMFKPQAVVVLIYADAYADTWNNPDKGTDQLKEWTNSIKILASNVPKIPVFVSSIDINLKCQYGSEVRLDRFFEYSFTKDISVIHDNLKNVYLLPVAESAYDMGRTNFYSPKMWYVGSMPYSLKGLSAISDLITRYINSISGAKKKCLVADLDNTLWGGVIGEAGVDEIVLSNHKEGARYRDAQLLLKKMKNLGVILAVISKNNPEDVEPVYKHPDMILHHEDFAAEMINWESKPDNIRSLAKSLNIGLDSFVFLDDNPAEREQMKAECPEVTVIDFPKDSSLLPDTIDRIYRDYFFTLDVTSEDLNKTDIYKAQFKREAVKSAAASVDDYLTRLEMSMDIHLMTEEEESRVTQLINKTNQFNVTTKRYTAEEVHRFAEDRDYDVITVHMADKYGDQGLVAVLILQYHMDTRTAGIDTFLMSCRVMGRLAEIEILSAVRHYLSEKGIEKVTAEYIKTAKNAPVRELFEKVGFNIISESEDAKKYEAVVSNLPESTGFFKETINL